MTKLKLLRQGQVYNLKQPMKYLADDSSFLIFNFQKLNK